MLCSPISTQHLRSMGSHQADFQKQVTKVYDDLADRYDSIYQDEISRAEDELLVDLLATRILFGKKVLDVGCGTGHLLTLFPSITWREYRGFDISKQMIRIARQKHPEHEFFCKSSDRIAASYVEWADLTVYGYGSMSYMDIEREIQFWYQNARRGARLFAMIHSKNAKARCDEMHRTISIIALEQILKTINPKTVDVQPFRRIAYPRHVSSKEQVIRIEQETPALESDAYWINLSITK